MALPGGEKPQLVVLDLMMPVGLAGCSSSRS
jgi:DNA-binding response OmpR family regulator